MRRHDESRLARMERKLDAIWMLLRQNQSMEFEQMADFSELIEKVRKVEGRAASTNTFIKGLQAKIDELAAAMNDEADQAKVRELSAQLDQIAESLPPAIDANPGGSLGGITE